MSRIYLACKLFNVNDRLASLALCNAVDGWIDSGDLDLSEHCFLPYRDSNNAIDPNAEDFGKQIFDLDIQNMHNSTMIAGYCDGPEYDAGMGFELGYMWTLGNPCVEVTTDYYTQTIGNGTAYYSISKYLNYIGKVLHISEHDEGITDYEAQCLNIRDKAWAELKRELADSIANGNNFDPALKDEKIIYDYYLDPNFKYYEAGRNILAQLTAAMDAAGKTYVVGDNQGDISADILNLARSKSPILFAEEFDPDFDSGIIQGISYGLGRSPIMYSSKLKEYITGDFVYRRNVMVLYSAKQARSVDELLALIRA